MASMMWWVLMPLKELQPLTSPLCQPLRDAYGDDWTRWVTEKGNDSVSVLRDICHRSLGFLKLKEKENSIKISSFYLSPEIQGQGTGTRVIEGLKKRGKILYCTVLENCLSVRRFYEEHGFRAVGERETKVGGLKEIVYEYNPSDNEEMV